MNKHFLRVRVIDLGLKNQRLFGCECMIQGVTYILLTFLLGKPSRPILSEVELVSDHNTRVLLYLDDGGESPIKYAYIEWSSTSYFNDSLLIKNISSKQNLSFRIFTLNVFREVLFCF